MSNVLGGGNDNAIIDVDGNDDDEAGIGLEHVNAWVSAGQQEVVSMQVMVHH
jgi:hypothetical protein